MQWAASDGWLAGSRHGRRSPGEVGKGTWAGGVGRDFDEAGALGDGGYIAGTAMVDKVAGMFREGNESEPGESDGLGVWVGEGDMAMMDRLGAGAGHVEEQG